MLLREVSVGKNFMGRLEHGDDLLRALTRICEAENITAGSIQLIGALDGAVLAVYDQKKKEYHNIDFPGEWEITSGLANISLKDGKPFVHVHLIIGDHEGKTYSGHLVEGCKIFACEFVLQELKPEKPLERYPDTQTGLTLWPED